MANEMINVTKTSKGFLSNIGFGKSKDSIVLQISEDGLTYNSTLGNIGFIDKNDIVLIELGKAQNSDVIKIGISNKFNLNSKLNTFRKKLSELYKKETGAEILIFPQDTDLSLNELYELMKKKMNK